MTESDAQAQAELALRAASGNVEAFERLMQLLWPELLRWIGTSRRMRALGASQDDVRDVGTAVLEKLQRDGYHALSTYRDWQERHPDKSFHDWLRIVAANVVRDRARGQRARQSTESPTRLLNELVAALPVDRLGARPPMTDAQTARQLLEFARGRLPEPQLSALYAWLQGASFEEIAERGEPANAEEARRVVRAAIATLRREFVAGS